MATEFKIESGIPMPSQKQRGVAALMRMLRVGDSFLYPRDKRVNLASLAKHVSIKVATRTVSPTEVRVWRIE